ncbi:MAG: extracellular solute-binding protein [Fibrobacteria bacterium]|nr:extracellular solute-binding protein [Fibrobacteria bacterium]
MKSGHSLLLPALAGLLASAPAWSAKKPLELWIMPNGANPQALVNERLEAFTKETGIPAKVVVLDWGEAWSRIDKGLSSGQGPDVVQLGTTWVSYFASKGWLAPLDGNLDKINPARFINTSLQTTHIDGNDTTWAVPWFVDVRVLMANRRILDSLGIHAADVADWNGYHKTLRRIREAGLMKDANTQVFPYGFPGKSDWNIPHNFAPWIWSEGGDFIVKSSDGKWRSGLLEKSTVAGIKRYLSFVQDSLVNPKALAQNTAQVTQTFNAGEQTFLLSTSEIVMQTRISSDSGGLRSSPIGVDGMRAFPVPAGAAGSVAFVGGSNLCLPKAKASSADALKLLLFLTRADNLDAYTKRIGFLPPDKSVLQEWSKDSTYGVMVAAAEKGKAYPGIPQWGSIEAMLSEMFGNVWTMLGEGGYYTDEELYKALTSTSARIDSLLGARQTPMPLDSFQAVLNSVREVDMSAPGESESKGSGFPVLPVAGVGLLLLVGLGVVVMRKKSS